ncbi:MAG: 4Fe-4S binding protein [Comamonadaceae bacterium]|nr:4Fe-4S binding protein [Comamonadaceae bacterium]
MAKRKIVEIDRDKCDGCGLCTTACAEGALALDAENKAVLVREIYCDGLGACLDVCPTGALKVVERESDGYDARAAFDHVLKTRGAAAAPRSTASATSATTRSAGPTELTGSPERAARGHVASGHGGCPGSLARDIARDPEAAGRPAAAVPSRLTQWPIQLHLVSPAAPYFRGSDLLVAADCTAFALGGFHGELLEGKEARHRLPQARRDPGLRREAGRAHQDERARVPDRGHHDRALLFRARAHRPHGRGARGRRRSK